MSDDHLNIKLHLIILSISILIIFLIIQTVEDWQFITQYIEKIISIKYIGMLVHIFVTMIVISIIKFFLHYKTILKLSSIAKSSGLYFFKHNCSQKERVQSQNLQTKNAKTCNLIYILGTTGWETFGDTNSPLHNALSKCKETKIILLEPLSDIIKERAKSLNISVNNYKKEIYDSVKYLKKLKDIDGVQVELKMYKRKPLWKYIILGEYVWIQQYPKDRRVQSSPCYAFEHLATHLGETVYDHIYNQFLARWKSHFLGKYNFDTDMLDFQDAEGNALPSKSIR